MARRPGTDERQEDFFGGPPTPPERESRPRAARRPPEQAPEEGPLEPDGMDVLIARQSRAELRSLAAALPDDVLAQLILAATRELRRRLGRDQRRGTPPRRSPALERAVQELVDTLAEPEDDDGW